METKEMAELHSNTESIVEADELIALIKAIKFKYPDYGCKRVYDEICTHGGKYAKVPLKRVKKYMQKLELTQIHDSNSNTKDNNKQTQQETIQLMTVGHSKSAVKTMKSSNNNISQNEDTIWLPVELDQPAMQMKSHPNQAVIRNLKSEEGLDKTDLGEIFKIQLAAEEDGTLTQVHPMLFYNKARDKKTFIHLGMPAYTAIQQQIILHGIRGETGGAKAFFYGKNSKENAKKVVFINTKDLAPFQKW